MTSTAIEIGQAIGGYAAFLAAIVAGLAVFIAYRLRPLRMRSIELHSDQLKQTILQWINDMIDPDSPAHAASIPGTHNYIEQIPEPEPYVLTLEKDILFRDLPNHLPSFLFETWAEYKRNRDAYLQAKQQLTQRVLLFATEATGIRVHRSSGRLPSQDVLLDHVLTYLFRDLDRIANGYSPSWFDPRLTDTELKFEAVFLRKNGQALIQSESEQRSRNIYAQLSHALMKATDLIQGMKAHREQFDTLYRMRKGLESNLQEWLKVPILPNECQLLKKGAR